MRKLGNNIKKVQKTPTESTYRPIATKIAATTAWLEVKHIQTDVPALHFDLSQKDEKAGDPSKQGHNFALKSGDTNSEGE